MTTFSDLMNSIDAKREKERASDREIAALTRQTIAEFDADTTAPDTDLIKSLPFDFDVEGNVVIGSVTLTDAQMWELMGTYTDGLCPCCGTEINLYEKICDSCYSDAARYRIDGPPIRR